jgi:hypothetical protein
VEASEKGKAESQGFSRTKRRESDWQDVVPSDEICMDQGGTDLLA